MIEHSKTYFTGCEQKALASVLESGHISMGEKVKQFEKELCELTQKNFAVCLDSGYSALRIALLASKIRKGDKVGIPAYSCVALINSVLSIDATPIPIDISDKNNIIDISKTKDLDSLKAIIVVHTFGEFVDIKKIRLQYGGLIIEDCAHALDGVTYGKCGDIVISSFYATKLIGIGEGGVILTDNINIYQNAKLWRSYTDQPPCSSKFNNKMTDLEATIGLCQLNKLKTILDKRAMIAARYCDELSALDTDLLTVPTKDTNRIWYRYVIKVKAQVIQKLKNYLLTKKIKSELPVEDWVPEQFSKLKFANTRKAYAQNLSIPIYPALTYNEQTTVIENIMRFFYEYKCL